MARKEKAERSRVTKTLSLAILGSILAIVFLYLGLLRGNTPTVEELLEEDSPDSKRYAATDISVSVTPDNRTSTRTPKQPTKAELDQEKVRKEQVKSSKLPPRHEIQKEQKGQERPRHSANNFANSSPTWNKPTNRRSPKSDHSSSH